MKTCIQLVSGFACGATVQEGSERCAEHHTYHMNKREIVLTLDESAGVYRCTSSNCSHDFSPYFGRDFAEIRDIRYTVQRLGNLGFRVTLIENHDTDTLNPHMVCEHDFSDDCPFCEIKFCNDCGKENPYYALWCEHCGSGEFRFALI